ncbi:S-adenosyl-L-methionine-dependent methyltransferase [Kalaharituber pfeilii]|nr:S-adenosyl-L-methionine-dependent methyltransferase [Kalaharituber pfeilii]
MSCCSKKTQCCSSAPVAAITEESETTYKLVQERYGEHAKASTADTAYNEKVATAFGYSKEDLESIPANSNLGVSCGNPLAKAGLKEGEVSIDLGSGAGLDVFLSAKKVGPTGKAIGVDMTDEMIRLANENAAKGGYTNTEFIKAFIHSIPLPDNTADCITSNCVINLVPVSEKAQVFKEIFRLLKPGGRIAVSDILAKKELTKEIKEDVLMYVGCIGGASLVEQYDNWMKDAGFKDIIILNTNRDLNVYQEAFLSAESAPASCCPSSPAQSRERKSKALDYDFNEWAGAYHIYAIKPGSS